MEAFEERLDDGITMEKDDNTISLDFSKIFGDNKGINSIEEHEMLLFRDLAQAPKPIQNTLEHPLCQAFLYDTFRNVMMFFIFGSLLPQFLITGMQYVCNVELIKDNNIQYFSGVQYLQWTSFR